MAQKKKEPNSYDVALDGLKDLKKQDKNAEPCMVLALTRDSGDTYVHFCYKRPVSINDMAKVLGAAVRHVIDTFSDKIVTKDLNKEKLGTILIAQIAIESGVITAEAANAMMEKDDPNSNGTITMEWK